MRSNVILRDLRAYEARRVCGDENAALRLWRYTLISENAAWDTTRRAACADARQEINWLFSSLAVTAPRATGVCGAVLAAAQWLGSPYQVCPVRLMMLSRAREMARHIRTLGIDTPLAARGGKHMIRLIRHYSDGRLPDENLHGAKIAVLAAIINNGWPHVRRNYG